MSVHDAAWLDALDDLESRAESAVLTALKHAGAVSEGGAPLEISLVFTDDAEQRALNRAWRGKDRPTNVLSFPNMDGPNMDGPDMDGPNLESGENAGVPRLLGDVVLARETVLREAAEQDKSAADHTSHLLVHGVLHLLGYDHEHPDEAEEMESLEREVLARLGIADPYATGTAAPEATHG